MANLVSNIVHLVAVDDLTTDPKSKKYYGKTFKYTIVDIPLHKVNITNVNITSS